MKLHFASGVAAIALLAALPAAAAPTLLGTFANDGDFNTYLANNGLSFPADEIAVAQTRIGNNNAASETYEVGLHIPPNLTNAAPIGATLADRQLTWGNNTGNNALRNFTLSRVGNNLTFTIGNYNETWTNALVANIDFMAFRLRGTTDGSTVIEDLEIDGVPFGDLLQTGNGALVVAIGGITGDFSVTGKTTFNWSSAQAPANSSLSMQIKMANGPDVPDVTEPATLALLGAGLLGLAAVRRRKTA